VETASGALKKNPEKMFIAFTAIRIGNQNLFAVTFFKSANSHTNPRKEYGSRVKPRMDTLYQNSNEGHSLNLIQKEPPVHKISTARTNRKAFMI
jgi:hypothetical protein